MTPLSRMAIVAGTVGVAVGGGTVGVGVGGGGLVGPGVAVGPGGELGAGVAVGPGPGRVGVGAGPAVRRLGIRMIGIRSTAASAAAVLADGADAASVGSFFESESQAKESMAAVRRVAAKSERGRTPARVFWTPGIKPGRPGWAW
ncbi:MAG: hypothetical protein ABR610_18235 [Thermoanaerobaculia bacterium]|nr:hypothetical protein [Acidobacteriota bacterium]